MQRPITKRAEPLNSSRTGRYVRLGAPRCGSRARPYATRRRYTWRGIARRLDRPVGRLRPDGRVSGLTRRRGARFALPRGTAITAPVGRLPLRLFNGEAAPTKIYLFFWKRLNYFRVLRHYRGGILLIQNLGKSPISELGSFPFASILSFKSMFGHRIQLQL